MRSWPRADHPAPFHPIPPHSASCRSVAVPSPSATPPWTPPPPPHPIPPPPAPFRRGRVCGGALAVGQATMDTIAGATRDTHATSRGSTPSRWPTLLQKGGTDERDTANRPHRRHGGADHAPD